MFNETFQQNAFSLSWEPSGISSTGIVDGFHSMRGWQEDVFKALHNSPYMSFNSYKGCGKDNLFFLP